MAAVEKEVAKSTADTSVDDDDAWLYGDDNKGEREHGESAVAQKSVVKEEAPVVRTGQNGVKRDDREEGEMSGEEGETQEKDDDDDSDDDDVQVTIGDIKAWNVNEQPRNLFKSGATYQKTVAGTTTKPAVTTKGLDIEAQGTINGIPVYEFDLDSIKNEDKPWRKPGADITDYFNYGFTEETWQLYCEKQRRLIALNEGTAPVPKIVTVHTASSTGHTDKDTMPVARRVLAPVTKPAGQINVIGATAKDSRRPESEGDPIPVAGSGFPNRKFVVPPPGLPPTNLPPPHLPPLDYSLPPPGLPPPPGVPPPSMTVPPPGFPPVPDPYETYFAIPPPDRSVPPPGFEDRQPFSYSNTHPTFTNSSYTEASRPQPPHQWDAGSTYSDRSSERDWERERERRESIRRDRSPHRSEEDFNRETQWRGHERDRERERERERDRSRDRDRERERNDRKRERDSLRRSRSRERDREPERSSRDEEKHRSRRSDTRKHRDDSDSESRSSKHKSRRRRREKDEEGGETGGSEDAPKAE